MLTRRHSVVLVACSVSVLVGGACSSSSSESQTPVVVVTYSALESIVTNVVGDAARVEVIIPNGGDPHDFEPSAKDVETMSSAALIVANGLDLEEGLEDALVQVEEAGVPVFHLADHVTVREGGAGDPHLWLDPMTLAEAIPALGDIAGENLGVELGAAATAVVDALGDLDAAIASKIAGLDKCTLITGHDSLGYFGARYGCEVIGSIIPGFSTAAEATAGDLAELAALARQEKVRAIFTELGTPADVAEALSQAVGVEVVEVTTHLVPTGGGYADMMTAMTDAIVGGLS